VTDKAAVKKPKTIVESKNEEKIVKRILKYRDVEQEEEKYQTTKTETHNNKQNAYDLWGDSATEKTTTKLEMKYPSLPLPHPGQSYNPSRNDLKNLLATIVKNNSRPEEEVQESETELEVGNFESEDENNEAHLKDVREFKVSNNPAILSTDKLTKTERNKLNKKNHNKRIEKLNIKTKGLKIEINAIKGDKKFSIIQGTKSKEEQDLNDRKFKDEVERRELIKMGIVHE